MQLEMAISKQLTKKMVKKWKDEFTFMQFKEGLFGRLSGGLRPRLLASILRYLYLTYEVPPAGYFPCKYRVPSLRYQASLKKALLQAFFWPLLGSWTESDWLHSIEFFSKALCFSQYFWVFFQNFKYFPPTMWVFSQIYHKNLWKFHLLS